MKLTATSVLGLTLFLAACGQGPSTSDVQDAIDYQIQQAGPLGEVLGKIKVTSTSCTSGPNDVYSCAVSAGYDGQDSTKTMMFKQVNSRWVVVS